MQGWHWGFKELCPPTIPSDGENLQCEEHEEECNTGIGNHWIEWVLEVEGGWGGECFESYEEIIAMDVELQEGDMFYKLIVGGYLQVPFIYLKNSCQCACNSNFTRP